jgi:tRNA(adenine34) deaminase
LVFTDIFDLNKRLQEYIEFMQKCSTVSFMQAAINVALQAPKIEVPIGAVVVLDGDIIATAHNRRESDFDPTAHAEILALRKAGEILKRWNLNDCDIYVTLEPCAMCAGAIVNARIRTLYFGAFDKRFGAVKSLYNIGTDAKQNHTFNAVGGVMESDCAKLLTNFFIKIRSKGK